MKKIDFMKKHNNKRTLKARKEMNNIFILAPHGLD